MNSGDSVRLELFPNITDIDGRTLDGNMDGATPFPMRYGQDTTDLFVRTFAVGQASFYTFPNPFKWNRADHREVDGVIFKNLHRIKGVGPGHELEIRIYTLTGELVASSRSRNQRLTMAADASSVPDWTWNLRNEGGRLVATGTYLYVISSKDKVRLRGKVAVIR
jgi:hypothetical protein